jgi:hypothetical protein
MSATVAALKYLWRVGRIWLTEELIGRAMKVCPEGYVMSTVQNAADCYERGRTDGTRVAALLAETRTMRCAHGRKLFEICKGCET